MGVGYLKIEARTLNNILPVKNADVTVKSSSGEVLYKLKTDESGDTVIIKLEAPEKRRSLSPNYSGPYYSTYNIEVALAEKFITKNIKNVQIFDTVMSTIPVQMIPKPIRAGNIVEVAEHPDSMLYSKEEREQIEPDFRLTYDEEIIIPEYLIVHLGDPDEKAKNVRVGFVDYIKNVASSEIYPTWPQTSLEANIYAIITFTLNRLFTKWYRGNGYNFDITSNAKIDQAFTEGKNIFKNITQIVDRIFNEYITMEGRGAPFFSQYCNGTTSNCQGFSKWDSVSLSNQGLSPAQILKEHYPKDVEIVSTNNIEGITELYPNRELKEGDNGREIGVIQECLNKININYPNILRIKDVNGILGSDTKRAVKEFQRIFNLNENGIIDKATWYSIMRIYKNIIRFEEIITEGDRNETEKYLDGDSSREEENNANLEFLLKYISEFYQAIPPIREEIPQNSIMEFQKMFGLTPNGVANSDTLTVIHNVYEGIRKNIENMK